MLFNSIDFAIFLPIVFIIYWFIINKKISNQNLLLLFASYLFYGWWDWRFLSLIIFSSAVDYFVGLGLLNQENTTKRKLLLTVSILVNIGFLMFFKYFNFFIKSFTDAFTFFGYHFTASRLNIVLPVGISFYTFQTLSYSIDVYRKRLEPTKNIISFFAFVSFFPQLVAGPIERASNLLPQFFEKRKFEYDKAADGMRQMLWGLFKKVVIADNCATYVNDIFANYTHYSGSTLFLGGILFAFQIYTDFSGYSDIAIGTARLFGFNLMRNFAFPYFSRDIAEFWRRWHISLSTWFRDYVYIPLGGSKGNTYSRIRNTFVIFVVSGFWHGANWTFLAWGFINACYFLPLLLLKQNRKNLDIVANGKWIPNLRETFQIGTTFFLTIIAWIFFRSKNIHSAFSYLGIVFSSSLFSKPLFGYKSIYFMILILLLFEWIQRNKQHALQLKLKSGFLRWSIYFFIFLLIFFYGHFGKNQFIYFQF